MKKYLLSFFFVSFFFSCVSPAFAAITGLNDIAYSLLFGSRRDGDSEDNLYNKDADAICKSQGDDWFRVKPDPNLSCKSQTVTIKTKEIDGDGNETTSEGTAKANCYYDCICDTSKFPYKEADVNANSYFKVADGAKTCKDPKDNTIYVSDIECNPDNATDMGAVTLIFDASGEGTVNVLNGVGKSKTCYALDKLKCRASHYTLNSDDISKVIATSNSSSYQHSVFFKNDPISYKVYFNWAFAGLKNFGSFKNKSNLLGCVSDAGLTGFMYDATGKRVVYGNAIKTSQPSSVCANYESKKAERFQSFNYYYFNGTCKDDDDRCYDSGDNTDCMLTGTDRGNGFDDENNVKIHYSCPYVLSFVHGRRDSKGNYCLDPMLYGDTNQLSAFKHSGVTDKSEDVRAIKVSGCADGYEVYHDGPNENGLYTDIYDTHRVAGADSRYIYEVSSVMTLMTDGDGENGCPSGDTCYDYLTCRKKVGCIIPTNGTPICDKNTAWGNWRNSSNPVADDVPCISLPTCEELGYRMTESACQYYGFEFIRCPYDDKKVFCSIYDVPDDCEVGDFYNDVQNKCSKIEGSGGYYVVGVHSTAHGKILETAVWDQKGFVLKGSECSDGSNVPVTCKSHAEMQATAREKCEASGFDHDLLSISHLEMVYNKFGTYPLDHDPNFAGSSAEVDWLAADGVFLTIGGSSNSTGTSDKGIICKKTFPAQIYANDACTAKGWESSTPAGQTCDTVQTVEGVNCFTNCHQSTCGDYGYYTVQSDGYQCDPVEVDGLHCYNNCKKVTCETLNYHTTKPLAQKSCDVVTPTGTNLSCYSCEPICAAGMYYDGESQYCTTDQQDYFVLSVSDIKQGSMKLKLVDLNQTPSTSIGTTLGNAISGLASNVKTKALNLNEYDFVNKKIKNKYNTCHYAQDGLLVGTAMVVGNYSNSDVSAANPTGGVTGQTVNFERCISNESGTNDMMKVRAVIYNTHSLAVCSEGQTYMNNVCYDGWNCQTGQYYDGLTMTCTDYENEYFVVDTDSSKCPSNVITSSSMYEPRNNDIPLQSYYNAKATCDANNLFLALPDSTQASIIANEFADAKCIFIDDGIYVDGTVISLDTFRHYTAEDEDARAILSECLDEDGDAFDIYSTCINSSFCQAPVLNK
ncbi:MAG: hypothetical protein E7004_00750 [Alphaproteobacteria bacterium]|nr:hypothetical protein [Alphaproteobacteria bacterium]